MEITDPSGRLIRWRLRLAEFDFDIQYKKGKLNCQGDCMSRLDSDSHAVAEIDVDLPCFFVDSNDDPEPSTLDLFIVFSEELPEPVEAIQTEEILREQQEDAMCQDIVDSLDDGRNTPFKLNEDGVLIRTATPFQQIVIPESLRARVLNMMHTQVTSGHPGERRMYQTMRKIYYWPSMPVDVYAFVRSCTFCARERVKLRKHANPLVLFPARAPLEEVAIDILGPFQKQAATTRTYWSSQIAIPS